MVVLAVMMSYLNLERALRVPQRESHAKWTSYSSQRYITGGTSGGTSPDEKSWHILDISKLNFFGHGYLIIYTLFRQKHHLYGSSKTKQQHNKGKKKRCILCFLLFMLLLSGDIQLNPRPSINNIGHTVTIGTPTCQSVDTQLIVGSLEPSLIPTGVNDCFNLVLQLDSITEGSLIIPQQIKQSRSFSPQKDSYSTLLFKTQSHVTSHLPLQQDRFQEKMAYSRAAFQQKKV